MAHGEIAFLPSIFRLPWHAKTPRIVGPADIARLLRAESIEITVAILLLLAGVHYFFLDILEFYLGVLNLPMAIIAHSVGTVLSVIFILYLNNVPFSWLRARMVASLPAADGAFAGNALANWQGPQRLWRFSLLTNETAMTLRKEIVLLYMVLLASSLPLLLAILIAVALGQAGKADGTGFLTVFGLYAALSIWAFFESTLVLRKRWRSGRARRLERQAREALRQDTA